MNEIDDRQARIRDAIGSFAADIKPLDNSQARIPNQGEEAAISPAGTPPGQQYGEVGSVNIQLGDVKIKKSKGGGKTHNIAAVQSPMRSGPLFRLNRIFLIMSYLAVVFAIASLYIFRLMPHLEGEILAVLGFLALPIGALLFITAALID